MAEVVLDSVCCDVKQEEHMYNVALGRKHRRVYTSSNVCHSHEWRVDTASGMTLKKQNACLHAVRHAVEKKIACIHGLRSEGVNTQKSILQCIM